MDTRVVVLKNAETRCPVGILYLLETGDPIPINVHAFLVQHQEGPLLVDVGVGPRQLQQGYAQDESMTLPAQLRRHGLSPEEIGKVVITHLHWDHFSEAARLFPKACFYIQRAEAAWAAAPSSPVNGYDRGHVAMVVQELFDRVVFVDGDEEIAEGATILHLPGHTPGLQGVAVETGFGRVVMPSDSVFMYRNIEENVPPGWAMSIPDAMASYKKVRRWADIVLTSHDPLVFKRFPTGVIG